LDGDIKFLCHFLLLVVGCKIAVSRSAVAFDARFQPTEISYVKILGAIEILAWCVLSKSLAPHRAMEYNELRFGIEYSLSQKRWENLMLPSHTVSNKNRFCLIFS